jgi:hypothetical protein
MTFTGSFYRLAPSGIICMIKEWEVVL